MLLFIIASLSASAILVNLLLKLKSADTRDGRLTSFVHLNHVVLAWLILNLLSAVVSLEYYVFVFKLKIIAVCIIPYITCWFFLNLIQSNLMKIALFRRILIVLPVFFIIAMLTNPLHRLIYISYDYPYFALGPLFWIYLSFTTAVSVFAYILTIRYSIIQFKNQPWVILIVICAFSPYILNMIFSFELGRFKWDLTPLGYFALVISFAYISTKSQLFSYRSETFLRMFDTVSQIIVTVNNHGYIVDANASFSKTFPCFNLIIGKTPALDLVEYVRKQTVDCTPANLLSSITDFESTATITGELDLSIPEFKTYIVNRYVIEHHGKVNNYVLTFADVSEYRKVLNEMQKVMAGMDYRDQLLNTVNEAAAILLNAEVNSFERAVYLSMQKIAIAVEVDTVYLWKNHAIGGKLYCSQVFEWSPIETMFTDDKLYSYEEVVPEWEAILSQGNIINSVVRDMSLREQAHLNPTGILSVLVVPIFIDEHFWGFVGYDDCQRERLFTKEEEAILRSGSLLIANAFVRNEQIKLMLEGLERERDLEIQKQTAQAANEAKTNFLARMSHEIRTPMNAIIGMSDLLLSENLNTRQHRYAEDIKTSSNALLDIINDILDLSKIHEAKLSLMPVHYDFKVFIDNICSMTQFLIQEKMYSHSTKSLKLVKDIQEDIPVCLYGDDVRLRQILLNLLSNAVKYTRKGKITLTIRFDEKNMMVSVADTGIGIPKDDIPTLFDAFKQVDTEKNRGVQGTGLGLSIVKTLVELMGGNISIESNYGKGSSFNLVLPYEPGNPDLIRNDNGDSEIVYAPDAKVLTVDDRESNLTVICGLLYQSYIVADKALSGAKAIRMVSKKQYDLIFLDHMMPDMDGVETAQKLREMGITIPIIALTANAISGAREFLMSSGMDDYLSKPIDKIKLYNILSKWLPAEKLTDKPEDRVSEPREYDDNDNLFCKKLSKLMGLNVTTGLDLASGDIKTYKNTVEVTMREIAKSIIKLNEFPTDKDLKKFCIEVHGLKGSFANIGASVLSFKAAKLEDASHEGDIDYCIANLDEFVDELRVFEKNLINVFEEIWEKQETFEIPPELPPILSRITEAMAETDFSAVYEEVDNLNALELDGAIKEEIEKLTEALMIMNYDHAEIIIERLSNG